MFMNHFEQQTNIISLKSKMAPGFSTLLVRELLLKICAFSGQLILARILSPDDFGFYAIIIFIINLFGLFSDIGLSSALIQKKQPLADIELATIFFIKCAFI